MTAASSAAAVAPIQATARRHCLRIDVTEAADLGEPLELAVELLLPEGQPQLLFVCVPGGGMNRRYFDLPTPDGQAEASFARAMAARGHAVALLDPLGIGESSLPADAYRLHPDRMAAANAHAARHVLDGLRAGSLIEGVRACPKLRAVGAGHSFGALLTIVHEAASPTFDAVALLGFHTAGLKEHLTAADHALDVADARQRLVEIVRTRFPKPYLLLEAPPSTRPVSATPATDRVLMTGALMAMLPGMVSADAARIEVPVLLAFGDGDLHDDPHAAPAAYPASSDVTLLVLRGTRHNHFIYPSRTWLFERIARWAEAL